VDSISKMKNRFNVGDRLAFQSPYNSQWIVGKVINITNELSNTYLVNDENELMWNVPDSYAVTYEEGLVSRVVYG